MNELLTKITERVVSELDKPCMIYADELLRRVSSIWEIEGYQGIVITPNRLGRILTKMGFQIYSDGHQRGWLIK